MPDWLVFLITLAAAIAAIKTITGWAPVRWVWKRIVVEPAQARVLAIIEPKLNVILDEVTFNHGSSMKDMVRGIQEQVEVVSKRVIVIENAFDSYVKSTKEDDDGDPEP